jgi:protein-serine/threonine kinase
MTQVIASASTPSTMNEKRNFSGQSTSSTKQNSSPIHFPQKFRNFFRIASLGNSSSAGSDGSVSPNPKPEGRSFRQSRFLGGITRNRSVTVNSEGDRLDDGLSPTAHANPYFAHQGPPALRHHNEGSVPPSPPDTMGISKTDATTGANDQATAAGKEELVRKLRRIASAPDAQGLFAGAKTDNRPSTAEMGKEPLVQHLNDSTLSLVDKSKGHLLPVPSSNGGVPSPGQIRQSVAFRRTYSSNSIKVRNVEVGPSSFDKIKLIGKGDVGKVYLVREKKSNRLYAMKGKERRFNRAGNMLIQRSTEQERNDQTQ